MKEKKIVVIQLGKRGLTESVIDEIKRSLEYHGIVKLRMLKSFRAKYQMNRRELAKMIAEKTSGKIVEIRG
ncbi:MAG TPA: YhbY family RNA-binding protein, partial [Thermoproteales archaeon]|nr:YhbY family RNA-binding protein [Thermoproteales archaeon]